jgi:hypothetical protein
MRVSHVGSVSPELLVTRSFGRHQNCLVSGRDRCLLLGSGGDGFPAASGTPRNERCVVRSDVGHRRSLASGHRHCRTLYQRPSSMSWLEHRGTLSGALGLASQEGSWAKAGAKKRPVPFEQAQHMSKTLPYLTFDNKSVTSRVPSQFLSSSVTHVANVVVAVLLIVAYTLLAVGPQRELSEGITNPLTSQIATWPVPILTLFASRICAWLTSIEVGRWSRKYGQCIAPAPMVSSRA